MYLPAHHSDSPAAEETNCGRTCTDLVAVRAGAATAPALPRSICDTVSCVSASLSPGAHEPRDFPIQQESNMDKTEKLEAILMSRESAAPVRGDYVAEEKKSYDPQRLGQRFPGLYHLIASLIGPTVSGPSPADHVPDVTENVVVNLARAPRACIRRMIHVDFVPSPSRTSTLLPTSPNRCRSDPRASMGCCRSRCSSTWRTRLRWPPRWRESSSRVASSTWRLRSSTLSTARLETSRAGPCWDCAT